MNVSQKGKSNNKICEPIKSQTSINHVTIFKVQKRAVNKIDCTH